jgi:hypothetical protein
MILYNVTTKVDWYIHKEWLQWMKEDNIPDMMATGFFIDYRMVRLLQVDETDGPTYAVQYTAHSIDQYNMFLENHLDNQYQKESNKWGNKFISFSTIMEVVR